MRITILANHDLHANRAVNFLRPCLVEHEVTLFLSQKVGRPRKGYAPPQELLQLQFLERDLFARLPTSGGATAEFLSFEQLGELFGTAPRVLQNVNKPAGLETFQASRPDLVISLRYGCILRQPAIDVPRLGVLNLHSGLLPRYQGILTTLHSLIEGQDEVGCTLHYIDSPAIDAGPVIDTFSLAVDRERSLLWHVAQLYPGGCTLIARAVEALSQGRKPEHLAQDPSEQAEYYGLPEAEHFAALQKTGFDVWQRRDGLELYEPYGIFEPA